LNIPSREKLFFRGIFGGKFLPISQKQFFHTEIEAVISLERRVFFFNIFGDIITGEVFYRVGALFSLKRGVLHTVLGQKVCHRGVHKEYDFFPFNKAGHFISGGTKLYRGGVDISHQKVWSHLPRKFRGSRLYD